MFTHTIQAFTWRFKWLIYERTLLLLSYLNILLKWTPSFTMTICKNSLLKIAAVKSSIITCGCHREKCSQDTWLFPSSMQCYSSSIKAQTTLLWHKDWLRITKLYFHCANLPSIFVQLKYCELRSYTDKFSIEFYYFGRFS